MNIRPSQNTDPDLGTYVRLHNALHPDRPRTLEEIRHAEATREPGEVSATFFAEVEGQPVGWAGLWTPMNPVPGQLEVEYGLLEGHEDLLPSLWAFLEGEARRWGAKELIARVREDWPELGFYRAQGFGEHDRSWASTLDLARFDPALPERPLPPSIRVSTLAELGWQDGAVQHSYYTLTSTLIQDVPWAEPLEVWPFALWRRRTLESPNFIPEGHFLALDGEQMVGVSQLLGSSRPQTLQTGLTGTLASHRRLGIARALKLRAAAYAKAQGYRYIRTTNHQVNRPMLALNAAMGFVKEPAWLQLKKELQP
jgi:GNAT superfamily N-acetyltransferase